MPSQTRLVGLNLSFVDDSPFSSAVVNRDSGERLYSISTQNSKTARNTTIRDGRGDVVGAHEQSCWPGGRCYDNVALHGRRCAVEQWLPRRKKSILSKVWILPGPNRQAYHWHNQGDAFKVCSHAPGTLVDPRTYETLAQSHPSNCVEGTKLSLDVNPEALPMLDAILLSFVVLEAARTSPVCGESMRRGGSAQPPHSYQRGRARPGVGSDEVERVGTLGTASGVPLGMTRSWSC
ncbi:hypothetical protein LXA43DRAFT_897070 [Ganoderma leucocontextum]|nr:hypothetical protein LXA43DRAFT_897070 [Ganoderma leucocontextum]